LALPAVFMEAVLYNSPLLTYGQIMLTTIFFITNIMRPKMNWDADLILKTYLHWLIKFPDHASYSDASLYQCFEAKNIPLSIKFVK